MSEDLQSRVVLLESWKHHMEIKQASLDSDRVHLDKELNEVKETLKEIKGNLSKVVWLILASIIGGFMTWVISGGLNQSG
jgi:hypothetical protein